MIGMKMKGVRLFLCVRHINIFSQTNVIKSSNKNIAFNRKMSTLSEKLFVFVYNIIKKIICCFCLYLLIYTMKSIAMNKKYEESNDW
ncbi:hypothetical protein IW15_19780 [Chryseobacterium soli]|uniref:Uncharacterized protein n=1 Tax=Chryseobacterium soli TaxID=445961 RepID=A0A086A1L4_9FLAO|nr:hypothetical protein IW15_19780 [Chryseobacterium soli]